MTALEHVAAPTPVLEAVATSGEKQGSIRAYVRRLAITDAVAIVGSVAAAQLVRFGTDPATLVSRPPYSYTLVSGVLVAAWIAALLISGAATLGLLAMVLMSTGEWPAPPLRSSA